MHYIYIYIYIYISIMLSVNKPNNVIHYDWAVGFKINEMLTFMFI